MQTPSRRHVVLALALLALLPAACAGFRKAGMINSLSGVVTLDRGALPPKVYIDDAEQGRWLLEGRPADDLRELDRARVDVLGIGQPRGPRSKEPGRFTLHAYRLLEVGGKPALVGRLAWEAGDLLLVELDKDDRRVALAGPLVRSLPTVMGQAIWVAGEPRQGSFLVERYGVLRR
jgi:hypothetical protein